MCVDVMGAVDVHEALGERAAGEDDEWMYTLEENAGRVDPVTAAVEACRHGRFVDALGILSGSGVEHTPIVRRLVEKVTKCHERGAGTEFADVY